MAWRDRLRAVSVLKLRRTPTASMPIKPLLTDVFIDGLNFYNGAVKDSPYKWLDFRKLAENALPEHRIGRIHYFTAIVQERPPDLGQPARQTTYLRALGTIHDLDIHLGVFRTQKVWRPHASGGPGFLKKVRILNVEEKQTDVNLATHLTAGSVRGDFQQAALISNDADFVGMIQYLREVLSIPVVVLNPNVVRRRKINRELEEIATYVRNITEKHLAQSQLPHQLTHRHGIITKPESW